MTAAAATRSRWRWFRSGLRSSGYRGVTRLSDGRLHRLRVGCRRPNVDQVLAKFGRHACARVYCVDCFGDHADAVTAGHVLDLEGDHVVYPVSELLRLGTLSLDAVGMSRAV
jgi:hypothetical protein